MDSPRLERQAGRIVLGVCAAAAVASFVWYYERGLTLIHYDAKAHLVVARRVVDAITPGYAQLGGHWLPLIHLLYLPLTLPFRFYRTGAAASLLSVAALVAASWLLYRIVRRVSGSAAAGVIAALLLVANPNVRFLASCPLTEVVFMALILAALDAFVGWRANRQGLPWGAAAWLGLACLCRYEGWYYLAGIVALLAWDFWRSPDERRRLTRAALLFLGFFAVPVALHFGYLLRHAGDTFLDRVARGNPAPAETYHRPLLAAGYHLGELAQVAGVVPLVAAGVGVAWCLREVRPLARAAPLFLLWLPSLTNLSTLYWGMIYRVRWSALLVPAVAAFAGLTATAGRGARRALLAAAAAACLLPWVAWWFPKEWRYHLVAAGPGLLLLPAAAVAIFIVAEVLCWHRWALPALLALALERPVLEGEDHAALREASEHEWLEPERRQILDCLETGYDGTRILVDIEKVAPLVYDSGLPLREFVHREGEELLWQRALADPGAVTGWACALRDDRVWRALEVDPRWRQRYALAVRTDHFALYRRKDAHPEGAPPR